MSDQPPQLTRDDAENIAWLMVVIICVIAIVAAVVSALRHNWYGLAGTYVLAGALAWYIRRLNRAVNRRNPF